MAFFKIVNNFEKVDFINGIPSRVGQDSYNLRGHSMGINRELVKNCAVRFNFFTNRVVNDWNSLPQRVIEANTTENFKAKLDEWWKGKSYRLAKKLL